MIRDAFRVVFMCKVMSVLGLKITEYGFWVNVLSNANMQYVANIRKLVRYFHYIIVVMHKIHLLRKIKFIWLDVA